MLRILFVLAGLLFAGQSIAGDTDPYEMSESDVQLAQTKLYGLNYAISEIDGKLGPETRKAIAKYQTIEGHPSTGIITEKEFKKLRDIDTTGTMWAALSSSTDGAYSSVWNRNSRSEAVREALNGCREKSSKPEKCITITERVNNSSSMEQGWIAAAHCPRSDDSTKPRYVSVMGRPKRALAVEGVFDLAMENGYSRDDCTLLTVIEVLGRHK